MSLNRRTPARKMLVEGQSDLRFISEFLEVSLDVDWEPRKGEYLIPIEPLGGIDKLLQPGVIAAEAKTVGLEALGIVVDANSDARARFQSIRERCAEVFPDCPKELPAEGLVHVSTEGPRFGVWLMPDNIQRGMLETFAWLVGPAVGGELHEFAQQTVDESLSFGATFREAHRDKALIHTWLAWQDEPGCRLHEAVTRQFLRVDAPESNMFTQWVKRLYELDQ